MDSEVGFIILLVVLVIGAIVVGGIMGCVALVKVGSLRKELERLRVELERMKLSAREVQKPIVPPAPAAPATVPSPVAVVPPPVPSWPTAVQMPTAPVASGAVASSLPAPVPVSAATASSMTARPAVAFAMAASATTAPATGPVRPKIQLPAPGATLSNTLGQLESKIGQRWIAWAGAIVVFLSAVFFLKHAFDNHWIGPTGQVAICALAAAVLVATGSHFVGKRWRILGQCVMGLGLGILYATFYSAFGVYDPPVMSQNTAFGFMVLVTVAGMGLAVMHDAMSMAFLAVLGGVLTPVLVSTGQDGRDVLFSYLLILDLGVMGVAFFRGWRLLDTVAMVGTFILYAGWYGKFYQQELAAGGPGFLGMGGTTGVMGGALGWLALFYLIFLVLPFWYHLVRRREITVERFVMAVGNAAFAASYAWYTLRTDYLFTMGFVALGMGAAYLALGAVIRRRLPNDARALFGMIAMTVTFLTLAVPMQLRAHGIMLAWVAEAPVLAYLGYRFRYFPVRAFALAVLVLGVGRLFLSDVHWPLHSGAYLLFFNRQLLSALAVPLAAAAYALVHQTNRDQETPADQVMKLIAALGGGLLALVIFHAEIGGWLGREYGRQAAGTAVTALWAVGSLAYLLSGIKAKPAEAWVWGVGTFVLLIAVLLCASTFDEGLGSHHILFANARFAAGLMVAAIIFGYAWVIRKAESPNIMLPFSLFFFLAAVVGLLVLMSQEVYDFCMDVVEDGVFARRAGQMSITLVWSIYAATLLVCGFWKRWRPLRLGGLGLFGIAALKLVLIDLTYLKDVYRIVSFFVLGLLMLAASYLYHRLEKRLGGVASAPPPLSPENEPVKTGEAP